MVSCHMIVTLCVYCILYTLRLFQEDPWQ